MLFPFISFAGVYLFRMHLFRGLQFKCGIGIIATTVILSAIYLIWDVQSYHKRVLADLQKSAGNLSGVTLNYLTNIIMLGKHPELLQESIQKLAESPLIVGVYLLNSEGTVRFSAKPEFVGVSFNKGDEGCRNCHTGSGNKPTSILFETAGGLLLRTVTPVSNRVECHSCHSARQPWIGMLIVDSATNGIDQRLKISRNKMLIRAGMAIIAMLAVLGIIMNKLVIVRLKKLTAATSLLTEEREAPELGALEGPDEIGQLATAFNRMVDSLGKYRRQVREKEQMRGLLLEKIVRLQEEERKKVSRELHDQLGPSLSALLLAFETDDPAACGSCEHGTRLAARIRQLIDEVHHLAWELRPSILDDYGLDSALRRYIDETSQRSSIKIDYQHISSPQLPRIPDRIEVTLYRVAQEAITNVLRHSRATQASVILLRQKQNIMLLVEDNGCGFRPPINGNGNKGLGLIGMRERVALCGGNWTVESAEGCGTTMRVTVPLEEAVQ